MCFAAFSKLCDYLVCMYLCMYVKVVTDYDAILNDDSINCVVELMGGVTDAKDVSNLSTDSRDRATQARRDRYTSE